MDDIDQRKSNPEKLMEDLRDNILELGRLSIDMVQWSPYIDWSKRLESEGYLKTPRLIQAFKTVKRSDFLPAGQEHFASTNSPVPIGYRQTNSQPSVVAEMLEWLEPKTGQRVLDIGSGSGWTTALLADVVGYKGHVLGLEKVPELVKWSRTNIKKYDYKQVEIREAGAKLGAPRSERFDSILVSAVGEMDWAADLSKQLTDSGRLVMPIFLDERTELDPSLRSQGILVMQKHGTKEPEFEIHHDFVFVPLIY